MKKRTDCPGAEKTSSNNGGKADAKIVITPIVIREYREARRESQKRFWGRFGVTQSRGSRFELGKAIPAPVVILLRLYWEGLVSEGDLRRAKRRPAPKRASANINRE